MERQITRKEKILQVINDKQYKPLKQKELAFLLQVQPEDKEEFRRLLSELVEEHKVLLSKRGKYQALAEQIRDGVFIGNAKGFGFVTVEGETEDYFIPENATKGAMHGDRVMIRFVKLRSGKRKEAEIIRVLERANSKLVGYYQKKGKNGYVIPDNRKICTDVFVPQAHSGGAVNGHKVVVRLDRFGDGTRNPEGTVVEILGHVNDPGTDILSIVRAFDLPTEFPDEVTAHLSGVPDEVSAQEIDGRLDLRSWQTVTIDGEDAKDLDDAITLRKDGDLYRLGVHIADVSHYVRESSALDREALRRGTSVYLVDRVIPMLPPKLSNGICSLNEGQDRLTLSCMMTIDEKGRITEHQIAETVIRVDHRMSYRQVDAILRTDAKIRGLEYDGVDYGKKPLRQSEPICLTQNDGTVLSEDAIPDAYRDVRELFRNMYELSGLLRKRRMKRGSIDFDFPETRIILEENGQPVRIEPYDRNAAHKLIEDFMLAANETVAEEYYWQEIPFEYRVHGAPDPEKIERLQEVMRNFGYYFRKTNDSVHPKEVQKLLKQIEGTPEEGFISRMTLRTMQQARYATECTGHFGLATRYYCHFTSPIRRYPDLQIHRIIKENLHGALSQKRQEYYSGLLPVVAESNSKNERRAQEAEREVEKLKKVQYMSKRIGGCYDGIISGVTAHGLYVELDNTVEGMIRPNSILDDYYLYEEETMSLVGKETRRRFVMGQRVRIRVVHTDKLLKTIDFELED